MGFGRELQQTSLSLHFTMKDRPVFIGALRGCIIRLIKKEKCGCGKKHEEKA